MIRKDTRDYCDGFASKTTSEKRGKRDQRATNQPSSSSTITNLPPVHLARTHPRMQYQNYHHCCYYYYYIYLYIYIYIIIIIIISTSWSVFQTGSPRLGPRIPDSPYLNIRFLQGSHIEDCNVPLGQLITCSFYILTLSYTESNTHNMK